MKHQMAEHFIERGDEYSAQYIKAISTHLYDYLASKKKKNPTRAHNPQ